MRLLITAMVLLACNPSAAGTGGRADGKSVEVRPPNGRGQKPAFAGQTRAPYHRGRVTYDARVIASGLEHPWSIAFLPDGRFLITERPGRLQIVGRDGSKHAVAGVPRVDARGQGGLFEIALDPEFATNHTVFFTYAEPREGGNGTTLATARFVDGAAPHLDDVQVLWRQQPTIDSPNHFGGRIVLARDGTLFVTTGERFLAKTRYQAQRLDSALGKIVRLDRDGTIPKDNPFVGRDGALPEIYSYGHPNVEAAAIDPQTGELWAVEHGPKGGDEINVIRPGKDYGWPTITYGIDYSGKPIGEGITQRPGMEQPIYYWDPSIAPSGMAFWHGDLFVGALAGKHVARLEIEDHRIVGEERLLVGRARFRDVRVGPDDQLYLITDEDNGELLQLVPRERGPASG